MVISADYGQFEKENQKRSSENYQSDGSAGRLDRLEGLIEGLAIGGRFGPPGIYTTNAAQAMQGSNSMNNPQQMNQTGMAVNNQGPYGEYSRANYSKTMCYFCGRIGHSMKYCRILQKMIEDGIVHRGATGYIDLGPIGCPKVQILRKEGETLAEAAQRMYADQKIRQMKQQPNHEAQKDLDPAKEKNQSAKGQGNANKGG